MSQCADNESSQLTPGNVVQALPAVINNDFHARIFFDCLSSRIMGKNLVYNEVIWRTKWSKGGWKVSDIVKVRHHKGTFFSHVSGTYVHFISHSIYMSN